MAEVIGNLFGSFLNWHQIVPLVWLCLNFLGAFGGWLGNPFGYGMDWGTPGLFTGKGFLFGDCSFQKVSNLVSQVTFSGFLRPLQVSVGPILGIRFYFPSHIFFWVFFHTLGSTEGVPL